jgi:RNA polymerase sigma-70 factor (ECF subfamily)
MRSTAEDVAHAAFERAYRKQDRYKPGKGTQRAWLFGIARNAALDELRRRKRTASLLVDLPDESALTKDDDTDERLRQQTVRAALLGLDARERELVALKFFTGLNNAEIAGVLGLSESNVGTRLHRAIKRLREACNA